MKKPYVPYAAFLGGHPILWDHSSRTIHDFNDRRPKFKGQVVPAAMTFGALTVGNKSASQTGTVTNVGSRPLPIRKVWGVGDFIVTTDCPIDGELAPGATCSIKIEYLPARAGVTTGGVYVDTGDAGGTEFISLQGMGITAGKGAAGVSVSSLDFGNVNVGTNSQYKSVTVNNLGDVDLAITSTTVAGEFNAVSGAPITLAPGEEMTFTVRMSPISGGAKSGTATINHNGTGAKTIALTGVAVAATILPVISISDGVLEPYLDAAYVTADKTALVFPLTTVGDSSAEQMVTLTNDGFLPAAITAASVGAGFDLVAPIPTTVPASGGTAVFKVKFTPTAAGPASTNLNVTTDATTGSAFAVSVSGSGKAVSSALPRLKIVGNQFVSTVDDTPVRLKSVNWFGAESTNFTPHGTWIRPWKDIIDDIAEMGFNCIRMPFSGGFTDAGRTPPQTAFDADANPDLLNKTALEIMDMILDYCLESGIYVVFDHHRREAGQGADGSPIASNYTQAQWLASWNVLATRYAGHEAVVGADVHNEPHDLTWADWATLAEAAGNAILATAPLWLIFVEGVGMNSDSTSYWWGGALKDVATRPITLNVASKVAYSPHEYGQSVGSQAWLSTSGNAVPNYPNNLYAVWTANWGFIFETNVAPIWIGEFGGFFGVDGNGAVTKPNATQESQWVTTLGKYLNGDFDGDGTSNLAAGKLGMSFAYWAFNPNSGDTGGLVRDDWITKQTVKLDLIQPLLA